MSRVLSNMRKKKPPPCRLPMMVLLASPRVGERCREATERGRCLEITSTTGRRYGGLSCSLNVFGGICGTRGRGGRRSADRRPRLTTFPLTSFGFIRSIRRVRSILRNWRGCVILAERRRISISGCWRDEKGRERFAPCRWNH